MLINILLRRLLHTSLLAAAGLGWSVLSSPAQLILWEAYNDYRPEPGVTHENVTGYDLRITDDGGVLRDFRTGQDLAANVLVVVEGTGVPDDFGANSPVATNSPADKLFGGKVVIGNAGLPGVRASAETKLILTFNNLDPNKRYSFRGTVSRGGNYNDRWSVFSIESATAYVAAHEDASPNLNLFTEATFPAGTLEPNQVALNSGENKVGSLVGWDGIEPGADGTFAIAAQQYTGPAPFGNPSAAAYGYGFTAIYLAEVASTGDLRITENPASQKHPAGATATFRVAATSPQPIQYQWQRLAPGRTAYDNIANANAATYTTAALTAADDGAKFRCLVTSGANAAVSGEATLNVDGVLPALTAARGSVNFNAIHLNFSEPMKLNLLATAANYSVSGGLVVSNATALDPTTVRLVTSAQTPGTRYTVTVNNVEDVAGNKIPADTTRSFSAFTEQAGAVGVELWFNIGGGGVADLRASTRYPAEPDVDHPTTALDSQLVIPSFPNNTYGGRIRAWITPAESGDYEFFVRGDDSAELRISTNDSFADLDNIDITPDATDTTAGDPFQEPGVDLSASAPITLVKGRRYAIQALWKESNGDDYCQIAWRKFGDATPADQLQPLSGAVLSYYAPPAELPAIEKISLQAGKVVIDWSGATLESSPDLKTWTTETGAAKPFTTTPAGTRFYRSRN